MLEHLPAAIGRALAGRRAGIDHLVLSTPDLARAGGTIATIAFESAAFENGAPLPERFTEDGDGVSPPFAWSEVPAAARALLLIVEDADSPTPRPLVHAIATGLETPAGRLAEGAIGEDAATGRNSFLSHAWLPPDPPPGHGVHRYVFQLYALDHAPPLGENAGRAAVLDAIRGHVLAIGVLVGTYERADEEEGTDA